MNNLKFRAVIEFLVLEGIQPSEIHERMQNAYTTSTPSYSTVKKWAAEFKRGRHSLEDDLCQGRPIQVVTPNICRLVEEKVLNNRRIKVREIAEDLDISVGSVETIIHEHLGMAKVAARWVPRLLTTEMKKTRLECSRDLLELYNADPEKFLCRIVTGDETWLHHYDPETKQASMQWKHSDSPPPKKARTQPSAGKIMATIFWDAEGIILIDYLPHKTTITGSYYVEVLRRLHQAIKNKRRGKLSHKVLLLHDNAPAHSAKIAQAAIKECNFQQLRHPPYSPDLAPSDFYLFRLLKKNLRGRRFSSDEEVKGAAEAWLKGQSKDFYLQGLQSLPMKWGKCIDMLGDYVEK
jgi:histone-lysine N-methyltransferase SETMAR